MGADPLVHAGQQVAEGLGRGQDVEGGRQGALVVEVAQPQFGPGEFPLLVLVVLQNSEAQREYAGGMGHGRWNVFHILFPPWRF